MKPINIGGHAAYQNRVLEQLRKYYPDAETSFDPSTWDIIERFYYLDLSAIDSIMKDRYSDFGPAPRLPSDMFRSYLLSMVFQISSVTSWVSDMRQNHLHALLSGFTVGDTPGIGTFYDFFDRLWLSDHNNLSDPVHPPKEKPKKPKNKNEKAPPVEKITVKDLFEQFEANPPKDMEAVALLFDICSYLLFQAPYFLLNLRPRIKILVRIYHLPDKCPGLLPI